MRLAPVLLLSALALSTVAGCASPQDEAAVDESDSAISSADARLKRELTDALAGLATTGSEGDPDPYKVIDASLSKRTAMTPEKLVAKLLPKMEGFQPADEMGEDYTPGYELSDTARFFDHEVDPADYEGDPEGLAEAQAAKVKWAKVQDIVQRNLTNVTALQIGYRYNAGGNYSTLETGAVAITLAGRTSSGRILAIYGIVIWT